MKFLWKPLRINKVFHKTIILGEKLETQRLCRGMYILLWGMSGSICRRLRCQSKQTREHRLHDQTACEGKETVLGWGGHRQLAAGFFLSGPRRRNISILSWNINGVCTKIGKSNVLALLMSYDVIVLNEMKMNESISLLSYVCFRDTVRADGHWGGTVVLLRSCLQSSVLCVDFKMKDQIWLRLYLHSNVLLGFIYVPPIDSQYFHHNSF